MSKEVSFVYGALCDDLETQANKQGYTLGDKAEVMEKLKNSANIVSIHGLATPSQADSIYKKLNNKVVKALKPLIT